MSDSYPAAGTDFTEQVPIKGQIYTDAHEYKSNDDRDRFGLS